jgi:aspartyl-tRNA synthetase
MFRTHTCGELRLTDVNKKVTLAGWVQGVRDKGSLMWIDLRDRYGITQITLETEKIDSAIVDQARQLGREFVIQVEGTVAERYSKSDKIATGDIEIIPATIRSLNKAKVPPFTIEENTDGGDDLRMKYRYLDLRRDSVRRNMELRHRMAIETRNYLDKQQFLEVETPVLIKSTPEGARDFVVPSRMNPGQFYALPQSPQTFKQLLIVKCFRDEDLRADRQPEFTQIDCEMCFVEQEDILQTFEGLVRHLFKVVKGIDIPANIERMTYAHAMHYYGSDKPDIRFDLRFVYLKGPADVEGKVNGDYVSGKNFKVFDDAGAVIAVNVKGAAEYTRKQLDELTEFVKRPQVGATGMIYLRYGNDGSLKSSVDKFYDEAALKQWAEAAEMKPGDLLLVLAGELHKTRKALNELRLEVANRLGLRNKEVFSCHWVLDFPLLEWSEDTKRWHAMHHPFTSPKPEDIALLGSDPGAVRANAYDMVINGVEVGGGSIRIFNKDLQAKMFSILGFTPEEAQAQFGFLMNAFEFGAPPHGGIAFGFDRLCSLFGGSDSIRDFIAFPKNNSGRDVMIDSPSEINDEQLKELQIKVHKVVAQT